MPQVSSRYSQNRSHHHHTWPNAASNRQPTMQETSPNDTLKPRVARASTSTSPITTSPPHTTTNTHIPQLDGPGSYHPTSFHNIHSYKHTKIPSIHPPTLLITRQQPSLATSAAADLLPYFTHPPLNSEQVIALSDVAGSLREVVLLALRAQIDEGAQETMVKAVGQQAAGDIVGFFQDEWIADSLV